MTREELESRYQLVQQVTEGDVRTHHAVAAGGTVVMVHFIRPGTPRGDGALAAVAALGEAGTDRILRRHQVDGEEVLVTRFLMDEKSLEGWLGVPDAPDPTARVEASVDPHPVSAPARPTEQPPTPAADDGPGEFTRLFRAVEVPDSEPPAPPPSPADPPPVEPPPPPPPQALDRPGEFTSLFQAIRPEDAEQAQDPESPASPPKESPAPPPAPPRPPVKPPKSAAPPPPPPSSGPPPPPPPPDPPVAGSSPPPAPGSFTQEFGRVFRPGEAAGERTDVPRAEERGSPPPPPPPVSPPRAPESPPRQPDFFLGEADDVRPGGASKEVQGGHADEYLDRLRSAGSPSPPATPRPWSPPPPPPPSGSAPPPPPPRPGQGPPPSTGAGAEGAGGGRAGPSDFTRVISAMDGGASLRRSAPPPPPVPRAPSGMTGMRGAPAGSTGDKRSTLLVVLGMGLVFLVALGVILYFALGSDSGTGGEGGGEAEEAGEVSGVLLRTAGSGPQILFSGSSLP